jgi:hypothetical protein
MYIVVVTPDIHTLIDKVNEYLQEGWKCQGGASYCNELFCQAMIRKEK